MTSAESLPIGLIYSHGFQHPNCTAGISSDFLYPRPNLSSRLESHIFKCTGDCCPGDWCLWNIAHSTCPHLSIFFLLLSSPPPLLYSLLGIVSAFTQLSNSKFWRWIQLLPLSHLTLILSHEYLLNPSYP